MFSKSDTSSRRRGQAWTMIMLKSSTYDFDGTHCLIQRWRRVHPSKKNGSHRGGKRGWECGQWKMEERDLQTKTNAWVHPVGTRHSMSLPRHFLCIYLILWWEDISGGMRNTCYSLCLTKFGCLCRRKGMLQKQRLAFSLFKKICNRKGFNLGRWISTKFFVDHLRAWKRCSNKKKLSLIIFPSTSNLEVNKILYIL